MESRMSINLDDPKDVEIEEEEEMVRCPACRGKKKCAIVGHKEFDCPLCDGEGEISFNELMEYIIETLCEHAVQIGG